MKSKSLLLSMIIVGVFGVYGVFLAQKIPINGGMGWDGTVYVGFVREWPAPITERKLVPFYLRKTLPSAIVHTLCRVPAALSGTRVAALPTETILRCFDLFNLASLLLAFFLFFRAVERLLPDVLAREPWWWTVLWVGANVYVAKMTFYYPALLDTFAFMLGALMLYGHAVKRVVPIAASMALGYFTHPLLFVMGALLLVWPERVTRSRPLPKVLAVALLVPLAGTFSYWLYDAYVHAPTFVRPAERHLLWVSAVLCVGYLVFVVHAFGALRDARDYLTQMSLRRVLLVGVLYAALTATLRHFQAPDAGWSTLDFLHQTGYDSMQDPLIFLVAHVVFFGPGILVLVLAASRWRPWLAEQSGGFELIILFMLVMAANNESRQLVVLWPFALVLVLRSVTADAPVWARFAAVGTLLLTSRFWLDMHPETFENGDYFNFPAQYYFMHQGPWMSVSNYYWQALATMVLAGLLYAYQRVSAGAARVPDAIDARRLA